MDKVPDMGAADLAKAFYDMWKHIKVRQFLYVFQSLLIASGNDIDKLIRLQNILPETELLADIEKEISIKIWVWSFLLDKVRLFQMKISCEPHDIVWTWFPVSPRLYQEDLFLLNP